MHNNDDNVIDYRSIPFLIENQLRTKADTKDRIRLNAIQLTFVFRTNN